MIAALFQPTLASAAYLTNFWNLSLASWRYSYDWFAEVLRSFDF